MQFSVGDSFILKTETILTLIAYSYQQCQATYTEIVYVSVCVDSCFSILCIFEIINEINNMLRMWKSFHFRLNCFCSRSNRAQLDEQAIHCWFNVHFDVFLGYTNTQTK